MSTPDFRLFVSRSSALASLLLALLLLMAVAGASPAVAQPALDNDGLAPPPTFAGWPTAAILSANLAHPAPSTPTIAAPPLPIDQLDALMLPSGAFNVSGPQTIVLLRTRFSDYTTATRYSQAQVQSFFDNEIDKLWGDISYGNISIKGKASALLNLPHGRASYITDHVDGDLSEGGQFMAVLNDAVAAAQAAGVDFSGAKDVMVLMGETDPAQYHRGQATSACMLPIGPGNSLVSLGCAIFSENPADPNERVWGRWSHEMGHAFQAADGPAHPSNYNNSFELMDRLYPGHSGMFSKQASGAGGFPGWIDPAAYVVVPTTSAGTTATLYPEELQPGDPGAGGRRAIKFYASASVYYIISVRQRMNGDEIRPIPDEHGVLIERVQPGADPWVTVKGPGGVATLLWQENSNYSSAADGTYIRISKRDPSTGAYDVGVARDAVPRPDVMIRPWLTPPLNTWETTDIWVDSSCNGYGTYMYGIATPAGDTTSLGYGNGDSPCANHQNRVYGRIRNIGSTAAANVVVHFQVTDPMGVGINGTSWVDIGTADMAAFPGLASLSANTYTDVYVPWTPSVTLTPEQIAAGQFNFHTCIRVVIDTVAGETIISNQDGIDEQENFGQFFAAPAGSGAPATAIDYLVPLLNDDKANKKSFLLDWELDLPAGWKVEVNGNKPVLDIDPGAVALVPVRIIRDTPAAAGEVYSMTLRATYQRKLVPDPPELDPYNKLPDFHIEFKPLGAVTLGVIVADPTRIAIKPQRDPNGGICVPGVISPMPAMPPTGGQGTQLQVDLLGAKHELLNTKPVFPDRLGQFSVCWSGTELRDPMAPRFATAFYQGQADLPSRMGAARSRGLTQAVAAGTFQQPAYAERLIAKAFLYLPALYR